MSEPDFQADLDALTADSLRAELEQAKRERDEALISRNAAFDRIKELRDARDAVREHLKQSLELL